MKKSLLGMAIMLSLTGCVSYTKQPLAPASAAALKDQTISTAKRKFPDFAAMTPAKAALGMFGAVAMISEGNALVSQHGIDDPANAISKALANSLATTYGSKPTEQTVNLNSEELADVLAAAQGKTKYLLDVQTVGWAFSHFPTSWGSYQVIYNAKARLIDVESKKVIAEGFCKNNVEGDDPAPSYDDMLANQAARLKQMFAKRAAVCVKEMQADILGK